MPTILTKKSDTPGAIPATANLTNAAGGAELAVNTADKRLFTITSGSQVVELGTNPASLTCADVSATVLRAGSATITNLIATTATVSDLSATVARISSLTISSLSLSNATFGSATITNLTSTSATISSALTLTGGTANGVLYLNASKVATSGSNITFDGTDLRMPNGGSMLVGASASGGSILLINGTAAAQRLVLGTSGTDAIINATRTSGTSPNLLFQIESTEGMRLTSTGLGIGTSSPATKLDVNGDVTQRNGSGTIIGNIQNSSGWYDFKASANVNGAQISTAAATPIRFLPNGVEAARFDSSGNLGLGVTPSAWSLSGASALQIKNAGLMGYSNNTYLTSNAYNSAGTWKYIASSNAALYEQNLGVHSWSYAASGTAGNAISFTQAMTLDASGNLGVGTTSPSLFGAGYKTIQVTGTSGAGVFQATSTNVDVRFQADQIGVYALINVASNHPLVFNTNATERARITSGGFFKASNTGTYAGSTSAYHELRSDQQDQNIVLIRNTNATSPYGIDVTFTAATPNNTTNTFITSTDSTNDKFIVYSSGTVTNRTGTYNAFSDLKLKQDVVDAGSQWNDIKALRVRKFRLKDEVAANPNYPAYIGLIAQEAEQVSPGLVEECADFERVEVVDEDGNVTYERKPAGTTTKSVKYSILYMKAVKALQEAMSRIEQLETKVAALESK
jgi:hypothetical protein